MLNTMFNVDNKNSLCNLIIGKITFHVTKYLNIYFNFHITACKLSQFLPHDKTTHSHDTNSTHTERGAH